MNELQLEVSNLTARINQERELIETLSDDDPELHKRAVWIQKLSKKRRLLKNQIDRIKRILKNDH